MKLIPLGILFVALLTTACSKTPTTPPQNVPQTQTKTVENTPQPPKVAQHNQAASPKPLQLSPDEKKAVAAFKSFFSTRQGTDANALLSSVQDDAVWMEHNLPETARSKDESAFLKAVQTHTTNLTKLRVEKVFSSSNKSPKLVAIQYRQETDVPNQPHRGLSLWQTNAKGTWLLARNVQYREQPQSPKDQKAIYANLPKFDESSIKDPVVRAFYAETKHHGDIFETLDDKAYAETMLDTYTILTPGQQDRTKSGVLSLMRTLRRSNAIITSKGGPDGILVVDDLGVLQSVDTVSIRSSAGVVSATMRSVNLYKKVGTHWKALQSTTYSFDPTAK